MKQYMVIGNFAPGRKYEIYKPFHEKGRMLPNGLACLAAGWRKDGDRCLQQLCLLQRLPLFLPPFGRDVAVRA
jgi:hypothetical protein